MRIKNVEDLGINVYIYKFAVVKNAHTKSSRCSVAPFVAYPTGHSYIGGYKSIENS